jgi:hypothetical protein
MKYKLFKIKPGKKDQWIQWCFSLSHTYRKEALCTLREEENIRETIILWGEYVLYGMKGNFKPASSCEINKMHFQNLKECLESVDPIVFSAGSGASILLDLNVEE